LYGIWLSSSCSNNIISGNTFTDDGLGVESSYNNSVEYNTVNGKPLVYLEGVANYTVGDAGQVILVRCDSMRVENHNLSRTSAGIELWETNNSIISRNNITANTYAGVYLGCSSNNSIIGNNIAANTYYGVCLLYSCSNNSIIGNNITNNTYGIYLLYSSNNSIFVNSITATANNEYGIYLDRSSSNSIVGNSIAKNSYGIWLRNSSDNFVYHNNFINNTQQVYFEYSGYTNFWDGNYWSDYREKYPDAKEIDGSGIWDTPYVIDNYNQDNYPIVPEFPTWTSILLILTVLTVAIAIYKRKLIWKN